MPIYLPSAFCAGVLLSFALPAAPPFWLFAVWAACAVPILRRFPRTAGFVLLAGAGLERTPSRRELPVGRGVTEECWGAAL